ncbi:MAG: right-handed parallel beta-helix repeat-containing protein [Candidatus Sumerlaeia bacterium]|nr:right-handed parallel beta-helix repeat-containing protein [Candidatus Sumerlaeia bacterium]
MLQRFAVSLAAMALAAASAANPLPHEHPGTCGSHLLQEDLARIVKERGAETIRRAIPLPAREAGSPDYLVRVIFLMPTDRQPADPGDYQAKVDEATLRIQASLETFGDYLESQMVAWGVDASGRRPNFERDSNGKIKVIALNGTMPTEGASGYWGDSTGLNAHGNVYFNAMTDIWGGYNAGIAACSNTVYMIFADTLRIDGTTIPPTWRGYLGGGSGFGETSSGYGGLAVMAYGALEFLPTPAGDSDTDRIAAFQSALCDTTMTHTIGSYTGTLFGGPPRCAAGANLNRTEFLSIYQGVMAHELMHGFGLGHDNITHNANTGVMSTGYSRYGAVLRTMYSVPACPAVPLTSAPYCPPGELGDTFGHRMLRSPYCNPATHPDKTDPEMDVAWPPAGYFYEIDALNEADPHPFRLVATDGGGSGPASATIYEQGNTKDYDYFTGGETTLTFEDFFYNPMEGRRDFYLQAIDNAGNAHGLVAPQFGRVDLDYARDAVWFNSLWVRRPAGEDTRPRDGTKPLGCFKNPYSDIQTAMTAAAALGTSAVVIGEGVWPLTAPLTPGYRVAVTGEGVGATILDGGGTLNAIFYASPSVGVFQEGYYSNLVLRNAQAGFLKANGNSTFHFGITNCVFHDLSGAAINLSNLDGNFEVSQNTVYNCGSGIRLVDWVPFGSKNRFTFRNNLVSDCTGTGIEVGSVGGLFAMSRVGGNLSFGNGTNWAGNGDGAAAPDYSTTRLAGEVSADPLFASTPALSPEDLKLATGSPARYAGAYPTQNSEGTPRDIGAWINNGAQARVEAWHLLR